MATASTQARLNQQNLSESDSHRRRNFEHTIFAGVQLLQPYTKRPFGCLGTGKSNRKRVPVIAAPLLVEKTTQPALQATRRPRISLTLTDISCG